jgi:membrane-bound serine protease (ClpP class)
LTKQRDTTGLKAWLLTLASLIDDVLFIGILFLVLRLVHVKITWPIILFVAAVVVAFFFIMHKAIVPGLRRRKMTGAEGMIGLTGVVTQTLQPLGMIKIEDEYWKANASEGNIGVGDEVEVVGINGLVLEVKRKPA